MFVAFLGVDWNVVVRVVTAADLHNAWIVALGRVGRATRTLATRSNQNKAQASAEKREFFGPMAREWQAEEMVAARCRSMPNEALGPGIRPCRESAMAMQVQ